MVELQERLYYCATRGDTAGMQAAIEDGAYVDGTWTDADGTPLAGAICSNSYPATQFLLDCDADPMPYADQLLWLVVDQRLDGFLSEPERRFSTAAELLRNGARVNSQRSDGRTALLLAASRRNLAFMEWLIGHGADVSILDLEGNSALHVAAQIGFISGIDFLTESGLGIDVTQRRDRFTPLHWAALDVLSFENADFEAADCLKRDTICSLIRHGADLSRKDHIGRTPLQLAVTDRRERALTVVELLNAGADIHTTDEYGNTPLNAAALFGKPKIAEVLLCAGAEVNAANAGLLTPFHFAVTNCCTFRAKHGFGLLELLLDHGAQINAVSGEGNTALHSACRFGIMSLVRFLVARGSDITVRDKVGRMPQDVAKECEHSAIATWLTDRMNNKGH